LIAKTGEISKTKIWLRYKIFQKSTLLWALQNLIFKEKYRKSFHESELGRLYSVFLFERIAKEVGLSEHRLGRKGIFSPCVKIGLMVQKAYTGFSGRQLVEHLNGNIHYQMFCGVMIVPSSPVTNYKIVSIIRNEIVSLLDIYSLQKVLASHWEPYLENFHVCD